MQKSLPKSIDIGRKIFIICLVLSVILIFNTYIKIFPISQSWIYIILLPLFAICTNLGLGLLRYFTKFLKKGFVFYLFQWSMTIILPFLLISLMELALQKIIMRDVILKTEPIINYINNYKKTNKALPDKIKITSYKIDNFSYYHNSSVYMVKTKLSTVDKQGEVVYFSSKDNHWYRFHKNQFDYFKDKKVMPPNIKNYIWFQNNTKNTDSYKK